MQKRWHAGNNRLAVFVIGTLSLAAWWFHAGRKGKRWRDSVPEEDRWEDFLGI
ncbi:MAG: hypothetical protein HYZ01_00595 [Ignavibacteriales bacterium]|nr:hypothetical protein [Ignavibacteriales bacterium]